MKMKLVQQTRLILLVCKLGEGPSQSMAEEKKYTAFGAPPPSGTQYFVARPQAQVTFKPEFHAFSINHKSLRGLNPTIKSCFFPGYSYAAAKRTDKPVVAAAASADTPNQMGMTGKELGTAVDRQVRDLVRVLAKYRHRLSVRDFLDTPLSVNPNGAYTRADFAKLTHYQHNMYEFTRGFLHALVKYQWIPLGADVPCGSAHARLGTAADVVCCMLSDPSAHIILELKCGFANYLYKYVGLMKDPYTQLTDCPYYQFQLQLAHTEVLFRRTYPQLKVAASYVINVNNRGVGIYPLQDKVRQQNTRAWKKMLEGKKLNDVQRKATISRAQTASRKQTVVSGVKVVARANSKSKFKSPKRRRTPTPSRKATPKRKPKARQKRKT